MSIFDAIRDWWKVEQQNWTLTPIPAPAVPAPANTLPEGRVVEMQEAYVTVRMRSMAIAATSSGWNKFHAALHSAASLQLKNGETATIQTVLSPDFMRNLDSSKLERVLHIDRTVFGPMPYTGGPLSLNMGVFAIKHADLAVPFIQVLEELTTAGGVAFVSAAKPFVDPIKKGVELLTGTADSTSLEIGILRDVDPLVTGWCALVRLPRNSVEPNELSVAPGNLELLRDGKSMPGTPYLVFSIDAATTRADWAKIPELKAAYGEFTAAVRRNSQKDAEECVKTFRRTAAICPELLDAHAEDVVKEVQKKYDQLFPGVDVASVEKATRGAPARTPKLPLELEGLAVTFRSPSVKAGALMKGGGTRAVMRMPS
ncbi:MAG: hypothetical protein ABFD97_23450 [Syntrophobacter sp.]